MKHILHSYIFSFLTARCKAFEDNDEFFKFVQYSTAEAVFGCGIFKADQNRLDDSATLTDIFKQYLCMYIRYLLSRTTSLLIFFPSFLCWRFFLFFFYSKGLVQYLLIQILVRVLAPCTLYTVLVGENTHTAENFSMRGNHCIISLWLLQMYSFCSQSD